MNELGAGTVLKGRQYQYTIVKVLGQGSFGITYLATMKIHGELGDLNVNVAVKEFFMRDINLRQPNANAVIGNTGLFDKYKAKFLKEAKNLAALTHDGIINVMEYFEDNSTAYYAMEFIGGGSLDALINHTGRLDGARAMELMRKIASAVQFMHSRGMVHLDIKPANIMMRDDDTPVLIDFGLSKQYDGEGRAESTTSIGAGTPGYAPIEQSAAAGHRDGLPVSMDLYALGATLFKMLTGRRPPEAAMILSDGFPPRPADVDPAAWRAVEAAMKPLKRERPASVQTWLDNYLAAPEATVIHAEPVIPASAPHPVSRSYDPEFAEEEPRKRRTGIIVAIVITAVVSLATIIVLNSISYSGNDRSDATAVMPDTARVEQGEEINVQPPEAVSDNEFAVEKGKITEYPDGFKTQLFTIKKEVTINVIDEPRSAVCKLSIEYPIAGPDNLVNATRRWIQSMITDKYTVTGSPDAPTVMMKSIAKSWSDAEETTDIKIEYSSSKIVTFLCSIYIYEGGAHGIGADSYATFKIKNGQQLKNSDLPPFSSISADLRSKLAEYVGCNPSFIEEYISTFPTAYSEDFTPYIIDDGLFVKWGVYALGPSSLGEPAICIAKSAPELPRCSAVNFF